MRNPDRPIADDPIIDPVDPVDPTLTPRPVPPRNYSDGNGWVAVIIGIFVLLGLIYWFTSATNLTHTASNTTTTTTEPAKPPIIQPSTTQPPAPKQ